MTNALLTDITSLKPGAPITHDGVTLIPIFAPEGRGANIKIAGDELIVSELAAPSASQARRR